MIILISNLWDNLGQFIDSENHNLKNDFLYTYFEQTVRENQVLTVGKFIFQPERFFDNKEKLRLKQVGLDKYFKI